MSLIPRGLSAVVMAFTVGLVGMFNGGLTAGEAAAADLPAQQPRPVSSDDRTWMPDPGFTTLITGTDLSGWHYKGEPDLATATVATDGRYSAKDGMLVRLR